MRIYLSIIIGLAVCALFVSGLLISWWTAVTVGLLLLGCVGYIEKIFSVEVPTKLRILFLSVFILLSFGNLFYSQYKEREVIRTEKALESLNAQLQSEKLIIRDFVSILKVTFSGKWTSQPYWDSMMPMGPESFFELQGANPNDFIKFYITQPLVCKTINSTSAVFESHQAVNAGSFPLGKSINDLSRFTKINMTVPFVDPDRVEGKKIVIDRFEIQFVVNGELRYTLVHGYPLETPIRGDKANSWASVTLTLSQPNQLIVWLTPKKK